MVESRYRDIAFGGMAPVLARFYGIVIRMYFLGSEHNPQHIHAIYGDDTAALLEMWETQEFKKLDPLE